MVFNKALAVVGLVASSVLASTPQGYGYGEVTESIMSASTDSPVSGSVPSAIMPITITDSITVTKPVTVTHTVTVSQSGCNREMTTIDSTISITRTTQSTIYVSVSPSPGTSTQSYTSVTGTGSSVSTSSIRAVSTTSYVMSNTTTCESITTTGDVDGATGSLSGTPTTTLTDTLTLGITPNKGTTTMVSGTAKSTTDIIATHTSSSTIPFSTIPTSMGVQGMIDARLLAGAMGLVSLILSLAL
ncbi:hypothetical protein GQX73_g7183 [Xylaria multiplex]|uniref:Uncharacterized protein n=1 Tax=Xylaria multiplex TaxID=323545 RepID=A0A7C8N224_9PEZI|nr:hypothetical protein GQX73_g7183 [Xylaria multiplex]